MPYRSSSVVLVGTCAGLLFATGCGSRHPAVDSSLTEVAVKGVVKVKGKAADGGGEISFNPSNVERKVAAFTAKIERDGSYSLKTFSGGNVVKFSGPFLERNPALALTSRYCELDTGENLIDFDLLGEGDQPRGATYPRAAKGGKTGRTKK